MIYHADGEAPARAVAPLVRNWLAVCRKCRQLGITRGGFEYAAFVLHRASIVRKRTTDPTMAGQVTVEIYRPCRATDFVEVLRWCPKKPTWKMQGRLPVS